MNVVLLFSYAHLKNIEDLAPFYKHLLRKHYSEESLLRGKQHFESLGTADSLTIITNRIGDALCKELTERDGEEWHYRIGTKHSEPFVSDVVKECVSQQVKRILTVPLTPLSSITGTEAYERQVATLVEHSTTKVYHLGPYYAEDAFIDVMARRLHEALDWLPSNVKQQTEVIFTAHSMPGIEEAHSHFIEQYSTLAKRLMASTNDIPYQITYRSGHPLPQKWLGPDVLDVLEQCAANGTKAVVVYELLSIVENAEVVQEIGRDALEVAHRHGMKFVQPTYLNDSFDFVQLLVTLCLARLEKASEIKQLV